MKKIFKIFALFCFSWVLYSGVAQGQTVKTNLPFLLAGNPNVGLEFNLGSKFSINGDALWMPYMWVSQNQNENVFRALVGSLDLRYYVKPRYYYTSRTYDGFYLGPYAMFGNYNMGIGEWSFFNHGGDGHSVTTADENGYFPARYRGWGVSAGLVIGYKFYLSPRLRFDIFLGGGFVHMQHAIYQLGGDYADSPLHSKVVREGVYPTRFGISLCYNIFK